MRALILWFFRWLIYWIDLLGNIAQIVSLGYYFPMWPVRYRHWYVDTVVLNKKRSRNNA